MRTVAAQGIRRGARVIRQQLWLILGIGAAFLAIGGITEPEPVPEYTASAMVDTGGVQEQVLLVYQYARKDEDPKYRLQREAEEALGPEVLTRAYVRLGGVPRDVEVTAGPAGLTGHLGIAVTGPQPRVTARVANAIAEELVKARNVEYQNRVYDISRELRAARVDAGILPAGISYFADLFRYATAQYQTRLDLLKRLARPALVARRAQVPTAPLRQPPTDGLLLMLGLGIGTAAAFLREALRRRREDPRYAAAQAGAESLGLVEEAAGGVLAGLAGGTGARPMRIAVCGLRPGDRAPAVAVGMACSIADQGERALLVEADLLRPRIAGRLGLPSGPGLAGVLAGGAEPAAALVSTRTPDGLPGPTVVPAGGSRPGPPEGCGPVVERLAAGFDVVVVTTPSPLESAELALLAPWIDRVVVVSERELRGDDELRAVRRTIRSLRVPCGLVLCDRAVEEMLSRGRLFSVAQHDERPEPTLAGTAS